MKINKKKFYLSVSMLVLMALLPVLTTRVYAQNAITWSLGVTVNNIPNYVNTIIVTVKNDNNRFTSHTLDASASNSVFTIFHIPADEIPEGADYKVCVHGSGGVLDWCQPFNHNGGNIGYVTVTWP